MVGCCFCAKFKLNLEIAWKLEGFFGIRQFFGVWKGVVKLIAAISGNQKRSADWGNMLALIMGCFITNNNEILKLELKLECLRELQVQQFNYFMLKLDLIVGYQARGGLTS